MAERINRFRVIYRRGINEYGSLTKRLECSDLGSNKYVLKQACYDSDRIILLYNVELWALCMWLRIK